MIAKIDKNVIALVKGEERYILIFESTKQDIAVINRTLGKWAADKELSFSWYDAAVISQKIRNIKLPE